MLPRQFWWRLCRRGYIRRRWCKWVAPYELKRWYERQWKCDRYSFDANNRYQFVQWITNKKYSGASEATLAYKLRSKPPSCRIFWRQRFFCVWARQWPAQRAGARWVSALGIIALDLLDNRLTCPWFWKRTRRCNSWWVTWVSDWVRDYSPSRSSSETAV